MDDTNAGPEMTPVESSSIDAIGHDAANNHFYVRFKTGQTYRYENVDADLAGKVSGADSVGKAFHQHIRSGSFKSQKIDE